jgi:hypothetical protein
MRAVAVRAGALRCCAGGRGREMIPAEIVAPASGDEVERGALILRSGGACPPRGP